MCKHAPRQVAKRLDLKRIALEDDFQRRVQQKTADVRKHSESERAEAANRASAAIAALENHKREASAKEAALKAETSKRELTLREEASSLENQLQEERLARGTLERHAARLEGKGLEVATERELWDALEKACFLH